MKLKLIGSGSSEEATNETTFTALLSQSGTNAPTMTILENSIVGLTGITWNYNNIGVYDGTLVGYTGSLINNFSAILGTNYNFTDTSGDVSILPIGAGFIILNTYTLFPNTITNNNGILNNTMFTFSIYT